MPTDRLAREDVTPALERAFEPPADTPEDLAALLEEVDDAAD